MFKKPRIKKENKVSLIKTDFGLSFIEESEKENKDKLESINSRKKLITFKNKLCKDPEIDKQVIKNIESLKDNKFLTEKDIFTLNEYKELYDKNNINLNKEIETKFLKDKFGLPDHLKVNHTEDNDFAENFIKLAKVGLVEVNTHNKPNDSINKEEPSSYLLSTKRIKDN